MGENKRMVGRLARRVLLACALLSIGALGCARARSQPGGASSLAGEWRAPARASGNGVGAAAPTCPGGYPLARTEVPEARLLPPEVKRQSLRAFRDCRGLATLLKSAHSPLARRVARCDATVRGGYGTVALRGKEVVVTAMSVPGRPDQDALMVQLAFPIGEDLTQLRWAAYEEEGRTVAVARVNGPGTAYYLLGAVSESWDAAVDGLCRMRRAIEVMLPETIGEWRLPGPPRQFDEKTIFDYIDGAAERHLRYNFARMFRGEYVRGTDTVVAEVYDMRTPADAFGLFSSFPGGTPEEIGQKAVLQGWILRAWQGAYYCEIHSDSTATDLPAMLREVGEGVCQALDPPGPEPEIVQALSRLPTQAGSPAGEWRAPARTPRKGPGAEAPTWPGAYPTPTGPGGFPPAGLCYFHRFEDLADVFYISTSNVLRLSDRTEGVLAKLPNGNRPAVLLAIRYPSAEERTAGLKGLWAAVSPDGGASKLGEPLEWDPGRWVAIADVDSGAGPMLLAVFDTTSREAAQRLLAELRDCWS